MPEQQPCEHPTEDVTAYSSGKPVTWRRADCSCDDRPAPVRVEPPVPLEF